MAKLTARILDGNHLPSRTASVSVSPRLRSMAQCPLAPPADEEADPMKSLLLLAIALFHAAGAAVCLAEPPSPNDVVLAKVRAIPDGGGYNWVAGSTGVPEEIRFKDTLILRKGEGGTYCCGITFAVVMQAADELKMLDDLSPADVKLLQKRFYGVPKDAQERQCVMALEESGLGHAVTADEAKAGDFLQFYRAKDGHSVIFLNWVEENGQRVGFNYRSSQKSTNGVGDRIEYFSDAPGKKGRVDRQRMYFGRLGKAKTAD